MLSFCVLKGVRKPMIQVLPYSLMIIVFEKSVLVTVFQNSI